MMMIQFRLLVGWQGVVMTNDPEITVIAKIPDHGYNDNKGKICARRLGGVYDKTYGMRPIF